MKRMTDDQENHLDDLKDDFLDLVDPKYRAGAAEHGGNIWDMPVEKLLESALEEVVDLFVYLRTLQQKLDSQK